MRRFPPSGPSPALLLALALALPAPAVTQAEPGPADVTGIVADVSTGAPIAGAAVRVRETSLRAVTDERGRFVLRGVPPGEHTWAIESLGYATWEQPLTVAHLDRLRIGLMPRPLVLEEIRVAVSRLESRRSLATVAVHTIREEALRASVATHAADLVRSRAPWPRRTCPSGKPGGGPPSFDLRLCVYYRGGVAVMPVCLDERPTVMEELWAYAADEIHSIDFVGGPRPHVRVYTKYFLEKNPQLRPLALGCRP